MRQALCVAAMAAALLTFSFCRDGVAANPNPPAPQVWLHMTNYSAQPGVDGRQGWNKMFGDARTPLPDFMDHVQRRESLYGHSAVEHSGYPR